MNTPLSPGEKLVLTVLAQAGRVTENEVLRIGLRLLWRLHRRGLYRPAHELVRHRLFGGRRKARR